MPRKNWQPRPTNWAGMVRDVLLASMNKGLFPLALAAGAFCFMVWNMTPEGVDNLMGRIYGDIRSGYLVGYILSCVLSLLWFIHAKSQRRLINKEISRISREKSDLQSGLLPGQIESSED